MPFRLLLLRSLQDTKGGWSDQMRIANFAFNGYDVHLMGAAHSKLRLTSADHEEGSEPLKLLLKSSLQRATLRVKPHRHLTFGNPMPMQGKDLSLVQETHKP